MSGPVRAGAGAGPGAEAACPTEITPPPAPGPRLVASVGTSGRSSNRRQGQPWGEPMRSKSSTNDAKDVRELEPGATQDSLVSGGEPLSSQQTNLSPETERSTADVATTTISPITHDTCTDTRNNNVSIQVHRARSRTQRPLSGRHTNTPLAAGANRRHYSGVRSASSRATTTHTSGRSGGPVSSADGMHASSKLDTAKKNTLSPDHSQPPLRWKSPRVVRQKSGTHRSSPHISKTETEVDADAPSLENTSLAATAAAEAALDAAVSAAMEASDAAAAAAVAATTTANAAPADVDTSVDTQLEDTTAKITPAAVTEFPRRSHTTSSQTFTHGRIASKPNTPLTSTTRSLAMIGHSHEHLYSHGREAHRTHHHRSRSHRNSSRRRRRHDSSLALTGNCWNPAHLHARLGGANPPCMVFVWPRPSADAMAAATAAAQAAAEAAGVLRNKKDSSDSTTGALTPARWLWRTLHLLAMLHLWPVEEGLALGLMFNLPHLRTSLTQATRDDDSVAVLQEPLRQQNLESAEESEGPVMSERPDSPAIVAAAPCFPYTPSTTGYPATRVRPRYGIMEPH